MGEASANMAHWAGLYGGGGGVNGVAVEGSGVTVSSPTSGGSGGGSPASSAPGVEGGRVGKPARRRSRASRRAPVTLLNTDTSNFRAMVQQFTGIPSGPYGPGTAAAGPVISFGAGEFGGPAMPVRPSPTSAVMSFDHLAHHHQHQHRPAATSSPLQSQLFRPQLHHHQQQQQQQQQQYGDVGGYGDMFLHHHGGFEPSSSAEDRLLLQSIQAAQMLPEARPSSSNTTNGAYNFG